MATSVIHGLLEKAVQMGASDVHLKTGKEPFFRVSGDLVESGFEALAPDHLQAIADDLMPAPLRAGFERTHEADFSHNEDGVGRFRVNLFLSQGVPALAMRHVKSRIPTFEDLNLPAQLKQLAHSERGIILLTGTTGSGKSTTLAALIGEINANYRYRIITVEDPIEYQFTDDQSIITQREVGLDTEDFDAALKRLMRQDPDVILIGEMRDIDSIRTALLAAETGHLVLSTLHASDSSQAVPRMLDVFPAEERDQIRMALAANLRSIISQRLIPDTHDGVVPAVEIMINTPTVRKLLERNQLEILHAAISTGRDDGMQSFNQSIYGLITSGQITEAEGMRQATNPESLRMNLQGIFLDEDTRILGG